MWLHAGADGSCSEPSSVTQSPCSSSHGNGKSASRLSVEIPSPLLRLGYRQTGIATDRALCGFWRILRSPDCQAKTVSPLQNLCLLSSFSSEEHTHRLHVSLPPAYIPSPVPCLYPVFSNACLSGTRNGK